MIGTLTYEQRQSVRDMKRQEIEAGILARMELGMTREQAATETLASLQTASTPAVKQNRVVNVQQTQSDAFTEAWQTTQKTAFALAAGSALVGIPLAALAVIAAEGAFYTWLTTASVAVPAAASMVLGLRSPYRAGKGWRQATLKTLPLIYLGYLLVQASISGPFFWRQYLVVAPIHAVVGAVVGTVGAWMGSKLRSKIRMCC
jgi:hypothetical protein